MVVKITKNFRKNKMKILELIKNVYIGGETKLESLNLLTSKIDFNIHGDYIELISKFYGIDGDIGEKSIAFWNIDDVLFTNELYQKENFEFTKKYFLFGSNSGIFTYAFLKENGHIVELDLYDESYSRIMGTNIKKLLLKLKSEKLE